MNAREQIATIFEQKKQTSVSEIVRLTGFSKQLVHRILLDYIAQSKIEKRGLPPKTIYCMKENHNNNISEEPLPSFEKNEHYFEENFLLITETGVYLSGYKAFETWCKKRNLPVQKTIEEYKTTRKKYEKYYQNNGLIDGTEKLNSTVGFKKIYLDKLYYNDFYAIERFGKTKLGTLLHFAKQGQNKFLMSKIMFEIETNIKSFIASQKIDAIIFVPPTIKRDLQIMTFIKNGLNIKLPLIEIIKINNLIAVPQKSLQKLDERIANADYSFAVKSEQKYNKVLMIDDAVGSGATMNQIAKKIKDQQIAKQVIGLAIVGSYKGFDVITDI